MCMRLCVYVCLCACTCAFCVNACVPVHVCARASAGRVIALVVGSDLRETPQGRPEELGCVTGESLAKNASVCLNLKGV